MKVLQSLLKFLKYVSVSMGTLLKKVNFRRYPGRIRPKFSAEDWILLCVIVPLLTILGYIIYILFISWSLF